MHITAKNPAGPLCAISVNKGYWKDKLKMCSNCRLSPLEHDAIVLSLDLFYKQRVQKNDPGILPIEGALIAFSQFGEITILEDDDGHFYTPGYLFSVIVCRVDVWRALQLNRLQIAAVILEELCHYAYGIHDEKLVKEKVVSILQLEFPDISFESFYHSFPGPVNMA